MSEPIIIKTPQPDTEERLVLVPPDAVTRTEGGDELLTIRTANARDATPADLLRAGYVPREVPSAEAWKAAHAEAERELIRARAALAEQPPGTLAHIRADALVARAEKAERERDALRDQIAAAGCEAAHAGERTYECDVARPCGLCRLRTRAEKAERELRDMSERAGDAERERDEAKELARVLEVERDAALDARNACAAERNEARAEVERLTAPGEGSEGEPTDEELLALFNSTVEANSKTMAFPVRSAVAAVAAHVRKECLVAQAVGMMPGVRSLTIWHEGPGANTVGVRVNDIKAIMQAPTDVPATLARLLGEVSR